jgi:hypothetical protein
MDARWSQFGGQTIDMGTHARVRMREAMEALVTPSVVSKVLRANDQMAEVFRSSRRMADVFAAPGRIIAAATDATAAMTSASTVVTNAAAAVTSAYAAGARIRSQVEAATTAAAAQAQALHAIGQAVAACARRVDARTRRLLALVVLALCVLARRFHRIAVEGRAVLRELTVQEVAALDVGPPSLDAMTDMMVIALPPPVLGSNLGPELLAAA